MKVAVMQPYFFPYIGYFQLIGSVDLFIVYDNIQYTKKGWINRNRILQNGKAAVFSLPLKKASDFADVRDREIAPDFNRNKLLNQIRGAYNRAPYFSQTFTLIEQIIRYDEHNLFKFLHHSIVKLCEHLEIDTEIRVSSEIPIDHGLRSQDKVLALCEMVGAEVYINTSGGIELYSKDVFRARGIDLRFVRSKPFSYSQFGADFVPALSIIDVIMFNPAGTVKKWISDYYEWV